MVIHFMDLWGFYFIIKVYIEMESMNQRNNFAWRSLVIKKIAVT